MKKFKASKASQTVLIGAFDSDQAGQACAAKLLSYGYISLKKPCLKVKQTKQGLLEDATDINDWYVHSLENAQNATGDDLDDLSKKYPSINKSLLEGV